MMTGVRGRSHPPIERPDVEDAPSDIGLSQGLDVAGQPARLHNIVGITEGQ